MIHTKEELNPVELATSSFGQTQTVTMVQMLSGFSSLINGGNYYQPHLVKEIQNSNGDVVKTIDPVVVKQTTTEDTSSKLRSYLKSTVEEGTAAPAQVKGYSIGGKTGTAEKRPVSAKKYLVSFIGCEPAEDPEVAYYVIIDEPHVKDQAHSTYATEFSSEGDETCSSVFGTICFFVSNKAGCETRIGMMKGHISAAPYNTL